jgi:hypothetical protein
MFLLLKSFLIEVGQTSDLCRNMIANCKGDMLNNIVLVCGDLLNSMEDVASEDTSAMSPDTYQQSGDLFPHQQKQCPQHTLKVGFDFIAKFMYS